MRLYLTRHGVTEGNRRHVWQGITDIPLSEEGEEQAGLLSQLLKDCPIKEIYSSPLQRAASTAYEVHKNHPDAEFHIESRLREIDFGFFEGMTYQEVKKRYKHLLKLRKRDKLNFNGYEGESIAMVRSRTDPVLEEILRSEKDTLIVSHGMVIRSQIMSLTGVSYEKIPSPKNTGLYIFNTHTREMEVYNSISHLEEDI